MLTLSLFSYNYSNLFGRNRKWIKTIYLYFTLFNTSSRTVNIDILRLYVPLQILHILQVMTTTVLNSIHG